MRNLRWRQRDRARQLSGAGWWKNASLVLAIPIAITLGSLAGCGGHVGSGSVDNQPVTSVVERGPVKLTVSASPKSAQLSDEVTLAVTTDAAEGVTVERPLFGDDIGEFVIRDFHEELPKTQDGRQIQTQVYQLEPMSTGTLRIDPIAVSFKPSGSDKPEIVQSESLTVNVASTLGADAIDLANLKPAAAPVEVPGSVKWLVVAAVAAAGALLAAGVMLWRRYRKWRGQAKMPNLSPRDLAALELKKLLSSGLSETDPKLFYVELTAIVRRYIERTVGIHAPEQTTEEFLREIGEHPAFSPSQRDRLANFLESADLVKFAGYQPMASAIDESVRRARVFVDLEEEVSLPHPPVRNGWHPREKSLLATAEKDVSQ